MWGRVNSSLDLFSTKLALFIEPHFAPKMYIDVHYLLHEKHMILDVINAT